jgi:hypothetical protein
MHISTLQCLELRETVLIFRRFPQFEIYLLNLSWVLEESIEGCAARARRIAATVDWGPRCFWGFGLVLDVFGDVQMEGFLE